MNNEIIELLFCVAIFLGITYLGIKEKIYETNPAGFKLILFIFIGTLLAFLFYMIPGGAKYTFTLIGITIGGAITKISYTHIRSVTKCSIELKGIYQGYRSYPSTKGISSYAPIFKYKYNGYNFLVQSAQTYSYNLLDKKMTKGEEYTIYVDPNIPSVFILEKRVHLKNILMLLFGILCICIGLYALIL